MSGKQHSGWGMGDEGRGEGRPSGPRNLSEGASGDQPLPHPSSPTPHAPLVIGVGNRLRGDDAAGLLVADLLKGKLAEGAVVTSDGDAADLVILWEEVDSVIVIDAMVSGRVPGTVVRHDVAAESLPVAAFATSSHHFGLAEALEISRALGTLPSCLVVYGIEVEATSLGTPLSPQVVDAVHRVVDAVAVEVAREPAAGSSLASRRPRP